MAQSGEHRKGELGQSRNEPARATVPEADRLLDLLHELEVHRHELALQAEELERARLELAAERERSFEFYELAPVAYLTLDRSGTIERANHAASTLLELERRALVGRAFAELMPAADAESFRRVLTRVLGAERRGSVMLSLLHRVPTPIPAKALLARVGSRVIVALEDLRELSALNVVVNERDAERHAVGELLRDALLVLDANYRVVSFNTAAERLLCRSGQELLGTPLPLFIPGVASAPRGGRVELFAHVGDGEQLPVEVAVAVPRGTDGRILAVVSDLSERRREQAERAEALLRFNEIAAHHEDAFYVASARTGKSLYVSSSFTRIYGRPLVAHEHTLWPRLEWVHFEDRWLVSDAAEAARDGAPYDLEYRIVVPSGEVRTIRDRAHVSADRDRITGVVRDVTRERELAEELRQSQRLEAMGTLATSVAHDFNNILMGIGGCVQLAQRRLDPADPASSYLTRASDAMLRGATLAKQILRIGDTCRLSDGQIVLDDVVFGARDLVESLLGPGIALSIVGQAPEVRVKGEAGDIEQILVNLTTNARDAMPAGGTLVLATELDEEEVVLSVRDTGTGMSAAVKARVFEPFFTTKRGGRGTGLGLATVAALARRLGGRVGLESTHGGGTTVSVALPIAKRYSQLPPASSRPPRSGGETVLLVDDDPLVRLTVENYLEVLGYRALSAADADEAIGLCEDPSLAIDLVISDIMMPGMLGGELSRELGRRNKAFGVIYMSAHSRDELLRDGRLEAESVLLSKPFDANELGAAIAAALEQKRHVPSGRGRRVLVIDDDPEIAQSLGELLELEQFEVRVAVDAESALAVAREFRPQIVVCDVELGPGTSGYELGVALRRTPGLAETYFIALSGHALADVRERALAAGFARVLGKPLELETLRRVLADAGA